MTNLNRYKADIFANTSRDALFAHGRAIDPALALNTSTGAHIDAARTALRQYMRAGGGFVGIHIGERYQRYRQQVPALVPRPRQEAQRFDDSAS